MIRLAEPASSIETFTENYTWPVISNTGNANQVRTFTHNLGKRLSYMHVERTSDGYRIPNHYRQNSQASPAGTRRSGWITQGMTDNTVEIIMYRWFGVSTAVRAVLYFFDDEEVTIP